MDPAELRQLLNEGIQAAKANQREQARGCLLRVLEADDHNEPAWLWLSAVLDEPSDRLEALERVLAINPGHPQAQAGAQALRQQLGRLPPVEMGAPAWASEPPAAPPTVVPAEPLPPANPSPPPPLPPGRPAAAAAPPLPDMLAAEDDPYQCAYCGRPTLPEAERCPHCRRSLLVPGPWHGGGYLYIGLIVSGLQLQAALVQALASYLVTSFPQASRLLPVPALWTSNLLAPALVRAVAWAVVVLLLLGENAGVYPITALVALADMVWAGVGYRLGYLPELQAALNAGLGVIVFLISLMAIISQLQSLQRLRVLPDRGLEGAVFFHRRALAYARQGRWALAALHWRRAITRAPGEPLYYKALGRANMRLGRFAEAVEAFKSGAEAAPNDSEFTRLIARVRAHARSS